MIDINALINSAIEEVVEARLSSVRTVLAEQAVLQARLNDMTQRIENLSASFNSQLGRDLHNVDEAIEALSTKEWFWAKVANFIDGHLNRQISQNWVQELVEESVNGNSDFAKRLARQIDFSDLVESALEDLDLSDKLDLKAAIESELDDIDFLDHIDEDKLIDSIKEQLGANWVVETLRNEVSFEVKVS